MNDDDESMLPPAGPEAEESPLELLEDMLHTIVLCKRSKRGTELVKDLISRYTSYW